MQRSARILTIVLGSGLLASPAIATPEKAIQRQAEVHFDTPDSPAPDGFVEMFVAGVLPTEGGPAVVLRDKSEKTLVPIWIGTSEAHSIQLRLERRRFPRPLTHDLLDSIMHDLGGEIVKIHVDDLKGDTFVGTVFVRKGDKITHFDARPSDSIALAVGNSAPIFVSRAVIERINLRKDGPDREPATKGDEEPVDETPPVKSPPPPTGIQTM